MDKTPLKIRQNVAHEIGHVILGPGHPDTNDGDAPLMSMQPDVRRLMFSGIDGVSNSMMLLVKKEWDKAEIWLKANPDKR